MGAGPLVHDQVIVPHEKGPEHELRPFDFFRLPYAMASRVMGSNRN
jgi:hypothetical protein